MGTSKSDHATATTRTRGAFQRWLARATLTCNTVLVIAVIAVIAALWLLRSDPAYGAETHVSLKSRSAQELKVIAIARENQIVEEVSRPAPILGTASSGQTTNDTGKRRVSATRETPLYLHDWFYSWNTLPGGGPKIRATEQFSNIGPQDYVGPETCGECHQKNYQKWSQHSHRWMNAPATSTTVKGRFDGSKIQLRGGTIRMYQENGQFWMHTQRGQFERLFRVTHTIGLRFLQYYIGVLEQGEPIRELTLGQRIQTILELPVTFDMRDKSHGPPLPNDTKVVLPVGYIIRKQQWALATQVFTGDDTDDTSDPYEGLVPVR